MWHLILSSDSPTYHTLVSTVTHGWHKVPLCRGQPRASSGPVSESFGRVTYLSCSGSWPNALSSPSGTRCDFTYTGQIMESGLLRGHTRRGGANGPRVRPSASCDAAAPAAAREPAWGPWPAPVRARSPPPPPPPPHRRLCRITARRRPPPPPHAPQPLPSSPPPQPSSAPSTAAAGLAAVGRRRLLRPRNRRPPLRHHRRPPPPPPLPPSADATTAALNALAATRNPFLPRRPRRRRPPPPVSAAATHAHHSTATVLGRPRRPCPPRLPAQTLPPPLSPPLLLSAADVICRWPPISRPHRRPRRRWFPWCHRRPPTPADRRIGRPLSPPSPPFPQLATVTPTAAAPTNDVCRRRPRPDRRRAPFP